VAVVVLAVIGGLGKTSTGIGGQPAGTTHPATTLLQASGNGIKNTGPFTVSGPWTLAYTYDCSGFGSKGNFIVEVADSNGGMVGFAANELGAKGSASTAQYSTGNLHLEVNSECAWTVTVTG
jgi:hypothetical protein